MTAMDLSLSLFASAVRSDPCSIISIFGTDDSSEFVLNVFFVISYVGVI